MPRTRSVCSRPGCPQLTDGSGRCDTCRSEAEQARGSAAQRGYDTQHVRRFRTGVLKRDPICVVCAQAPSTVADHWPLSRRQLVAQGMDPNDPQHGRGLCASDHGRETAANPAQRGGWNA
jgi:5-methylcytosine-specific restriction enzyme A